MVSHDERAALRHGLAGFIAEGAPGAPPALAQAAALALARAQVQRRATLEVAAVLRERGVRPILLKGYALARRLYPECPGMRESSDVDLLVERASLGAAAHALRGCGFALASTRGELHHTFRRGELFVELHYRLWRGLGSPGFDEVALFRRSRTALLDGQPVRLLAPEDEFLYLVAHAANHGFARLAWLVDLARYPAQEGPLHWARIHTQARSLLLSTALRATALLLRRELAVDLPLPPATAAERLREALVSQAFAHHHLIAARHEEGRLLRFALTALLTDNMQALTRMTLAAAKRALGQAGK